MKCLIGFMIFNVSKDHVSPSLKIFKPVMVVLKLLKQREREENAKKILLCT